MILQQPYMKIQCADIKKTSSRRDNAPQMMMMMMMMIMMMMMLWYINVRSKAGWQLNQLKFTARPKIKKINI